MDHTRVYWGRVFAASTSLLDSGCSWQWFKSWQTQGWTKPRGQNGSWPTTGVFGATRVGIIVIPRGPLGFRPGLKWPRFSGQTWARNWAKSALSSLKRLQSAIFESEPVKTIRNPSPVGNPSQIIKQNGANLSYHILPFPFPWGRWPTFQGGRCQSSPTSRSHGSQDFFQGKTRWFQGEKTKNTITVYFMVKI